MFRRLLNTDDLAFTDLFFLFGNSHTAGFTGQGAIGEQHWLMTAADTAAPRIPGINGCRHCC